MAAMMEGAPAGAARRIGILIVAYNAESTLEAVIGRIPADVLAKVEEIFLFDDASADRTFHVGQQLQQRFAEGIRSGVTTTSQPKLSVFRNPVNLMYGGNQRRGYQYAIERGLDVVVLLHGDGQYAPEVMQDLLTPVEAGEADLVMGSRMLVRRAALRGNMPLYKYVGNKVLTFLQNLMVGSRFSEFHSGYRAYSVHALRTLPLDELTAGWHFDTQIILELLRRGHRIVEVPIPTYYGDEICHVNGIAYAWRCLRESLLFALRHRRRSRVPLSAARRPSQ